MTSNPTAKLYSDSGQKCYDSSRTDSGFLSGANLISEENLSSDDLSPTSRDLSSFYVKANKNESSMQLDSGVDIGLNEQFIGLSLHKNSGSDLNQCLRSKYLISSNLPERNLKSKEESSEIIVTQPWELYFQQDEEGDTQLHIGIIQGFIEVVYTLIRMAPHPCFLDIHNDVVQSPLHLAVLTRQPRIVRRLVVAGASVGTQDRRGNTPLHLACQMGDIECVRSLTEPISVSEIANADLLYSGFTQQVPQDLDERNYDGETCAHLAAYGGHTDILRHLLWFGANINARENKSGKTLLHHAVEESNHKLLRFLLDECSFGPNGLKINTTDYAGHTAYQLARVLDAKAAGELLTRGGQVLVEYSDSEDDDHPDHNATKEDEEMNDVED